MQVRQFGAFDRTPNRNAESKVAVLDRLVRQIDPDGYLVLGAAETVVGLTERFRPHPDRRGLYMPNGKPASAATPRLAAAGGVR
jgi:chemotaxis protein methyltransferase CheR